MCPAYAIGNACMHIVSKNCIDIIDICLVSIDILLVEKSQYRPITTDFQIS